jgi:hypothetical protein
VVFVVRDARANIRSILSRLGLPGDLDEVSDEERTAVPAAGDRCWTRAPWERPPDLEMCGHNAARLGYDLRDDPCGQASNRRTLI